MIIVVSMLLPVTKILKFSGHSCIESYASNLAFILDKKIDLATSTDNAHWILYI